MNDATHGPDAALPTPPRGLATAGGSTAATALPGAPSLDPAALEAMVSALVDTAVTSAAHEVIISQAIDNRRGVCSRGPPPTPLLPSPASIPAMLGQHILLQIRIGKFVDEVLRGLHRVQAYTLDASLYSIVPCCCRLRMRAPG